MNPDSKEARELLKDKTVHVRHYRLPKGNWPKDGLPNHSYMRRYIRSEGRFDHDKSDHTPGVWPYVDFSQPNERGGGTTVLIYDSEEYELVARGTSLCSLSDSFCYRTGRLIALGRALDNLVA